MKTARKRFTAFLLAILFYSAVFCLWPSSLRAEGSVSMSVTASNTTEEKQEKFPIRQDLPKEIKKEDILDAGGMEIRYDEARGIYYLYAEADLDPSQSKSFTPVVKDIWKISEEEMNFIKEQADQRLESLKGKPEYDAAKALRDGIVAQVDEIRSLQESQQGDIQKRMEVFRAGTQRLSQIREQVGVAQDFIREAERYSEIKKENKLIKFVIEAKNPSEDEAMEKSEISRYLPQGIEPAQIVDSQGFELKFDNEKKLYYLQGLVDLKPGETKKFEILISDHWSVSEKKLEELKATDSFTSKLVGSGYEKLGAYLTLEIKKMAEEIKASQSNALSPEDRIAAYTVNLQKLTVIKNNLDQLRRLVEAAEKAKAKKLNEIIKTVTPDVATTWKIIYATITFLAIVSLFFYFLWWGQAKAKQNQKLEELKPSEKEK